MYNSNEAIDVPVLTEVPRNVVENILAGRATGDGYGTNRQQLMAALEESANEYREAFREMTPIQKAYGALVSKLLQAHGNADIEKAFAWFETEYGQTITIREKCLALFQAAETLDMTEATYRGVRKIFVVMNNKD